MRNVEFEHTDSIYFHRNRIYYEKVEAEFSSLNFQCSGYCNAFGYKLVFAGEIANFSCELIFTKSQSMQNGVIVPVNSRDVITFELRLAGFSNKLKLFIVRSAIVRMFNWNKNQTMISPPYALMCNQTPTESSVVSLSQILTNHAPKKLRLDDGKLVFKMSGVPHEPLQLVRNLITLINNWSV